MYFRYATPYLFIAVPITLISWYLVWGKGPGAIGMLLFLKFVTMMLGVLTLRNQHQADIFFFQNIGYGERQLLAVTGVADILIWVAGISLITVICY